MRWRLSLRARADLREIFETIAFDDRQAAMRWANRMRERARLAGRSPGLGRRVPELDRDDVREAIVGNYRLIYSVGPKAVTIMTIMEGHRLLPQDLI